MIVRIIEASLKNRQIVVMLTLLLTAAGIRSLWNIPVDAIPDLSDVQVIVISEYPGQAPQLVEDQVTYPLTSAMLAVPHAKVVRGYSFFGFSLVYVIFEDGTDLYWARSRVLEYLNSASGRLPQGVKPRIGPDATGVGWVYIYTVQDKSGKYNLQELRSIQDWMLKYELSSLKGVSEVASIGGFVKQYQVVVDPNKLVLYNLTLGEIRQKLAGSNIDAGGRLIEMGEREYMVRGLGYFESIEDIRSVLLRTGRGGNSLTIGDIADVAIGPDIRRGLAEWNGEGETVAGIVIVRYGENALEVIERIKKKIAELGPLLPAGVEIVPAYDRSVLIKKAVRNVGYKLLEEMAVVAIVIIISLLHVRSSLVAVVTLPVGVLGAILLMDILGINSNIMSLGGIAIAVGVMVDASVVMVENLHKQIEADPRADHMELVRRASVGVGPALFFSLVIITVSFLPVLLLEGQSGRLFGPLVLTKTFALAFASLLAITIVPVLMTFFVRGNIRHEKDHPVSVWLVKSFSPVIEAGLDNKKIVLIGAVSVVLLTLIPLKGIPSWNGGYLVRPLGGEFMPPLNEGDILYMPTTLPGISIEKGREILQRTDRIIAGFPEVKHVLGKIGRADTATDPAPLTMVETHVILKDRSEWRKGMTIEKLMAEMNREVSFPGLTNSWTFPIQTRIDMLSTGIKTPVGIKLLGDDLSKLSGTAAGIEGLLSGLPGARSVIAERPVGGKYIDFKINRAEAARYGLTVSDIQDTVMIAIGGRNITETVEGLARYPVNIRYPREYRDDISKLGNIWITTADGASIPVSRVAKIEINDGPPQIKTENARKTAWIYIDLEDSQDVASYVRSAREFLDKKIESGELKIPPGVIVQWSGQYEHIEKSEKRLFLAGIFTLVVIIILLYLHFRDFTRPAILLGSLLFAVTGGVWLIYAAGYSRSVATDVGFISLAGLSVETGIVLLVYLDEVFARYAAEGRLKNTKDIRHAMMEGVVMRIRPKFMTTATTFIGLLPIMWAVEEGTRVMKRLAAPMIGGLVTDTVVTLIIIPVVYEWLQQGKLARGEYLRK